MCLSPNPGIRGDAFKDNSKGMCQTHDPDNAGLSVVSGLFNVTDRQVVPRPHQFFFKKKKNRNQREGGLSGRKKLLFAILMIAGRFLCKDRNIYSYVNT